MALRTALVSAVLAVLLVLAAAPAGAVTNEEVAAALRNDPVYVDPAAERRISEAEADDLRARIGRAGTPVFVALLPASMGDADAVLSSIQSAVGLSGTYAVVVGDGFRVASDTVRNADAIATAAFQRNRDRGTAAVLAATVEGLGSAGSGGGSSGRSEPRGRSVSLMPLLVVGLLAFVGFRLLGRRGTRRRAAEDQAELEADRQMLRAELSVLAHDVMGLEPQVAINEAARPDYEAAVSRFRAAEAALDYADDAVDLVRVQRVVSEATYAMSRARAIVEGREPPPPPEELRRPGRHDEPPLDVDPDGMPAYVGHPGAFYGGGGWFGGGGGLFSGLLIGSMLGGWGGFGGGWHGGHGGDGGSSGGDWGGGGGDWGGGDVGGGDWG